jgi:hypothetical protein
VVLVGTAPLDPSAGLGIPRLTLEVELYPSDGEVVSVFCSLPSQLLEAVLHRSLVGRSLADAGSLARDVRRSYRGPAVDAVCTAIGRAVALLPEDRRAPEPVIVEANWGAA